MVHPSISCWQCTGLTDTQTHKSFACHFCPQACINTSHIQLIKCIMKWITGTVKGSKFTNGSLSWLSWEKSYTLQAFQCTEAVSINRVVFMVCIERWFTWRVVDLRMFLCHERGAFCEAAFAAMISLMSWVAKHSNCAVLLLRFILIDIIYWIFGIWILYSPNFVWHIW